MSDTTINNITKQFLDKDGLNALWNKICNAIDSNAIIIKGDVNNSAVLRGEYNGYSNKAISQVSMAVGAASNAGLKGYYYNAIDFANKKIYISASQPNNIKTSEFTAESITCDYVVGDYISIVADSKFENCSKITAKSLGVITVDSLPFTADDLPSYTLGIGKQPDDFTLYSANRSISSLTNVMTVKNYDKGTVDIGGGAHAEGIQTFATNIGAHAEGIQTHAYGQYSHAEGFRTQSGYASHAEGKDTIASGSRSHAEGQNTVASGDMSHAQGIDTIASGSRSFATGNGTIAGGPQSITGGYKSKSVGDSAVSIGHRTFAKGIDSICVGTSNNEVTAYESKTNEEILASVKDGSIVASIALGKQSQSFGGNTFAYGDQSFAGGWRTKAIGNHSHAEGNYSIAEGNNSFAGGNYTEAKGAASFAAGDHTLTTTTGEAAFGKYNNSTTNTLFSVGVGTSSTNRKNAFELTKTAGYIYDKQIATINDIPTSLKNPYSLIVQGNGTTIDSYDGSSTKTINITPASIGADTKPFSTKRDFENGTLIKTNIDYSVTNGVPFYVEIKGNTYDNIGSMFIQAQGYIYENTIVNYSITSLGKIYPEQFIAINVDGNLCFWFPRIGYWHGYSVKVTTGYDYSVNCVTDVIDSAEPSGTKRVVLSNNYFINHGFDGNGGVSINPAGNWYTPIYINGNNEALPVERIEDTLIKWKHPDQINQGTNLETLFSPIDTATSQLHSANRLAFGNPNGITVEYSTDGGTTWVDYGLTDAQKINLISNKSYGTELRAGKALSTRATANDKLRITINASEVGFYTCARALYINFSTNGSDNCIVDVERAARGSETNFTTWKTGLILNGWSGWNKLPLGDISFGGGDHQTTNVGAIRLTISSNGASSSYTGSCYFSVYDLQLIGDTTWSTCSNMGKNGHIYDHDYNQNALFPASITATGFIKNNSSDSYVLLGGGGHKLLSDLTDDVVAGKYIPSTSYGNYNVNEQYNAGVVSGSMSNLPSGDPYGILFVLPYRKGSGNTTTDFAGQIYIPCGDDSTNPNDMFFRTSKSSELNEWNTWNTVITDKNIGSYKAGSADSATNADTVDGKHASDFAVANHAHIVRLSGEITPNVSATYSDGILTINGDSTQISMVGTSEAEGASPNPESWFVDPDDMAALF